MSVLFDEREEVRPREGEPYGQDDKRVVSY